MSIGICAGSSGAGAMDDCFQETLMSALLAYPKLTHSRNLRSWLFTIAHNKGIDHFRKASREDTFRFHA